MQIFVHFFICCHIRRRNENFKNTIRLHLQRIMGSVDLEDVNVVQVGISILSSICFLNPKLFYHVASTCLVIPPRLSSLKCGTLVRFQVYTLTSSEHFSIFFKFAN